MDRNSFNNLLTDLYEIYQPSKKADIPGLLEKYNGQEFDALYHIFFKYNYPKSEHYNPELGTPVNIKFLIDRYSAGERALLPFFKKEPMVNQQEIIEQKVQQAAEQTTGQVRELVEDKIKNIDQHIEKRLQEIIKLKEELGIMMTEAANAKNRSIDDSNVEIKLNLLWTEKEVILPQTVGNMCIGTRFLVFDVDNKFHGFEIKDITEDYISAPGKCIKEITIDKI